MTTATEIRLLPDIIKPKPKQTLFLDAVWEGIRTGDPEYILFGGAAGPGKSYAIRWGSIVTAIRIWKSYAVRGVRQGIFCETYGTLRDRQIDKWRSEVPRYLGTYNESTHNYTLADSLGGGVISFRNLDDPGKYDSAEFAVIWVDELTKNTRATFDRLRSRKRWAGIPHSPFAAATNPSDVGLAWVRKLWVEHDFSGEDAALGLRPFRFIPALPTDNDSLPESYYSQTLASLPPHLRKALLEGDWYVFQGQAFPEFQRRLMGEPYHVVPVAQLPDHWRRIGGHDWGYAAPSYTCWGALDPEGGIVVYRELMGRGWEPQEIAQRILEAQGAETVSTIWCDPSIWAEYRARLSGEQLATLEASGQTQLSIADHYRRNGLTSIQPANNARLAGKQTVHQALRTRPDGVPYLRIMESCPVLIYTLQNIQLDPRRTEDVITEYGPMDMLRDDAYDALRGMLMAVPGILGTSAQAAASQQPLIRQYAWGGR